MMSKITGCALSALAVLAMGRGVMGEVAGPPWLLVATGDFGFDSTDSTPDGRTDLLWWNKKTGSMMIHYLNDDGVTVRNISGSVDRIDVLDGGRDYFSNDRLVVDNSRSDGTGLRAQLEVTGPIADINVLDPGRDYTSGPLVERDPGAAGGTGLNAVVLTADSGAATGELAEVGITSAGSGYYPSSILPLLPDGSLACEPRRNPEGTIVDAGGNPVAFPLLWDGALLAFSPDGEPAAVTLEVNAAGEFVSATVQPSPAGFTETPDLQFFPGNSCGSGASFQAYLYGGIKSIVVVDGGEDYSSTPEWSFPNDEGTGALLETIRGPGPISGVDILDAGRGYSYLPTVEVESVGPIVGRDAEFNIVINADGPQPLRRASGANLEYHKKDRWFETKVGDFDGDGDADILFHRRDRCTFWFLQDGVVVEVGTVPQLVGSSWKARAVGDLDADGDDDILFWNKVSGTSLVWRMNHAPGQIDRWVTPIYGERNPNTQWQPFAARDISPRSPGAEILWGNVSAGSLAIYEMDPARPTVTDRIISVRDPDGEIIAAGRRWAPIGWADFNSNASSTDVIMRNQGSGATAVWQMDFSTVYERDTLTSSIGDAETRYADIESTDFMPIGVGEFVIENEQTGAVTRHAHVFWQQKDNRRAVNWRVDRSLSSSLTNIGLDGFDTGRIQQPFFIDGAFLMRSDGTVSELTFVEAPVEDEFDLGAFLGGSGLGGSGGGSSGFDIDRFNPSDSSTWPAGISTGTEMCEWLGFNVLLNQSLWPSGIDTQDEIVAWVGEQCELLGLGGGSSDSSDSTDGDSTAEATGACCFVFSGCRITTERDCTGEEIPGIPGLSFDAEYQGDGTTCAGSGCEYGACCVDGFCVDILEDYCEFIGTFQGVGTDCSSDPCTPTTGACCTDGVCEVVTELECTDTYFGDGTDCSGDPCTPATGACCDGESCTVVTELDCEGVYQGDGTDCTGEPCAPATGACCDGESCTVVTELDCEGVYQGDDTDCTGEPCAPATGACCVAEVCSVTTEADCGGEYQGDDTDCTTDPCAPATGACCVGGSCSVTTEAECAADYLGDGTDCSDNPCELIGLTYNIVGQNLVMDDSDTWTVDVYAVLTNGSTLLAVAGTEESPLNISSTTSFYQNEFGSSTSAQINPALFAALPDVEFDSFVTIGLLDQTGNSLSSIGVGFDPFESGGSISTSGGSWFIDPDNPQGDSGLFQDQTCQDSNGVLIARLTVRDLAATVQVSALFTGRNEAGDSWSSSRSITIDSTDCDP
tara:strand:- start:48101 stop:51898 length:3798 start_codon:yes stop_codon:yes gene_type:complete